MKLDTKRLILRDYDPSDLEAVHHYGQDPQVVKFMLWGPNTLDETQAFIDQSILESQTEPRRSFNLAVIDKSYGLLIGGISLTVDHQRAEIGWILDHDVWGKGYATEAAQAMIHFGFEDLGCDSIFATCDAQNDASYNMMLKCGMTQIAYEKEARLSTHLVPSLRDQRRCEITRAEYLNRKLRPKGE